MWQIQFTSHEKQFLNATLFNQLADLTGEVSSYKQQKTWNHQ